MLALMTERLTIHRRYVGKYESRVEAELAYDEAAAREAIRMHTIPERMPPRRMRIRPCGRHYTIEVDDWSPVPTRCCSVFAQLCGLVDFVLVDVIVICPPFLVF